MAGPQVGVVIAAYGGERWVINALASWQAKTLTSQVAVLVDDGSTDRTARLAREVAAADDRLRVVVSQANVGVAAAGQRGLEELRPDVPYLAFLDVDARYALTTLATLLAALEARPDAVGSFALAGYIDAAGDPVLDGRHEAMQLDRRRLIVRQVFSEPPERDLTFDALVVASPIWPSAVALLRADAVRAVGGPDPSFTVQEDSELYLRMSRRGPFGPPPDAGINLRALFWRQLTSFWHAPGPAEAAAWGAQPYGEDFANARTHPPATAVTARRMLTRLGIGRPEWREPTYWLADTIALSPQPSALSPQPPAVAVVAPGVRPCPAAGRTAPAGPDPAPHRVGHATGLITVWAR